MGKGKFQEVSAVHGKSADRDGDGERIDIH